METHLPTSTTRWQQSKAADLSWVTTIIQHYITYTFIVVADVLQYLSSISLCYYNFGYVLRD